jgi:hypothetical protein
MKHKLLALVASLGVAFSAQAQLGGFGSMLGGAAGAGASTTTAKGDLTSQIDGFNSESKIISDATVYALLQIQAALGDKQDAAMAKQTADNLSKATDPKEIGSIKGTVIKEQSARSEELLKSAAAKEKMAKLKPEMQKKVAASIFTVGVAALKIPGLLNTGQGIVSGLSTNPMMITKLVSIKDGISLLGDALPKLGTIASVGVQLVRDVKVDPGNPTAETALKVDTSVSIPES